MTTWVYIKSEPNLWTVGFYAPDGEWQPESDFDSTKKAAARVHYLNGGNDISKDARLTTAEERLNDWTSSRD